LRESTSGDARASRDGRSVRDPPRAPRDTCTERIAHARASTIRSIVESQRPAEVSFLTSAVSAPAIEAITN